jgi:hypothetical protein
LIAGLKIKDPLNLTPAPSIAAFARIMLFTFASMIFLSSTVKMFTIQYLQES